jgi:hypothetical protein
MKTIMFILFLFTFFSCDKAANFKVDESEKSVSKVAYVELQVPPAPQSSTADRKMIKKGQLVIAVEDISKTKKELEKICKEYNAYISSETQNNLPERLQYEQEIRVPSASFDALVQKVEAQGRLVESKSIQTTDVTEEFIDKEARIKTKKELENRYYQILKQANKVSDMLAIEEQLNQVRYDIESMEGRIHYLRNQVAFGTLILSFYQPIGTESGFGSKILASVSNGWDMVLVFIIGIMNIWPFLLMVAAIIYLIFAQGRFKQKGA